MKRILLVGNGFNLLSDRGISWKVLLNKLAGATETKREEEVRDAKPFTLWFEELQSRARTRDVKQTIADYLRSGLSANGRHVNLMTLGFQHILTTNYDYTLESAAGGTWTPDFPARETYYSLFRRHSKGDRHIWHIHGELDNMNSIMLGHEQYSGDIHKIRNYLTTGVPTKARQRHGKAYLSKFSRENATSEVDVETWVDLFLEYEVHIVGFSFDYSENHLWNLITEKRRLRKLGRSIGSAVFHHCSDGELTVRDEAKLSILRGLKVNVVDHTADSYEESYDKCIGYLS